VSTIAESDSNHHLELKPGLERLGKIEEQFLGQPIPLYEPLESGVNDNVFLSKSYDATSHFETATGKLLDVPFTSCLLTRLQMTLKISIDALKARTSLLKV
jgi:Rab GDP dissociation inhibitor